MVGVEWWRVSLGVFLRGGLIFLKRGSFFAEEWGGYLVVGGGWKGFIFEIGLGVLGGSS